MTEQVDLKMPFGPQIPFLRSELNRGARGIFSDAGRYEKAWNSLFLSALTQDRDDQTGQCAQ